MRVEYELLVSDLIAADFRCLERSGVVRRQIRNRRLFHSLLVGGPVSAAAVYAISTGEFEGWIFSAIIVGTPMLILAAWLWVSEPRNVQNRLHRCLKKFYRTDDGQRLPGPRRLELSEVGISVATADGESLTRWPAITGVTVANYRCFIAVPGGELVVPLRELSPEGCQEFLREVVRYRDDLHVRPSDVHS